MKWFNLAGWVHISTVNLHIVFFSDGTPKQARLLRCFVIHSEQVVYTETLSIVLPVHCSTTLLNLSCQLGASY